METKKNGGLEMKDNVDWREKLIPGKKKSEDDKELKTKPGEAMRGSASLQTASSQQLAQVQIKPSQDYDRTQYRWKSKKNSNLTD